MSGGNFSCELVNQIGETFPDDHPVTIKDNDLTSEEISRSILNDILENALDIATKTSEKEVYRYEGTLIKSLATKTEMSNLSGKEVLFPDLVGDINDSCPLRLNPSDGIDVEEIKSDELVSQHPPPEKNFGNDQKPTETIEGLGDHEANPKESTEQELVCPMPRMVEKKSRLTDLVKSSRQVISHLLKMDEDEKNKQDEWEKLQESVLKVIELEDPKTEDEEDTNKPESVRLPDDIKKNVSNEAPEEKKLDNVDLSQPSCSNLQENFDAICVDVCQCSCPRKNKVAENKGDTLSSVGEKKKRLSWLYRLIGKLRRKSSTSKTTDE